MMQIRYAFSLVSNKLQQISAKSMALQFPSSKLQPIENLVDIQTLVPNFFVNSTAFLCYELKPDYKLVSADKNFNSVTNSFTQLQIPLRNNEKLRSQFTKLSTKYLRIGRLLEVLDGLVGMVAYKHAYTDFFSRKITIATLGVYDFLVFREEFDYCQDLTLNSYVSYVGKSSIEINTDIYQENKLAATVSFVMVARNAENYLQSVPVPQLLSDENIEIRDLCQIRRDLGYQNQRNRILSSKRSLLPPNQEESLLLHNLILQKQKGIKMKLTKVEKNTLMHTQDRNLHGKAFGGHIMKEILELGWLVGYKYTLGGDVRVIHIFDVTFLAPVPIGSVIQYSSQLCYVEDNIMIIQIEVDVHNYVDHQLKINKTTQVFLAMQSDQPIEKVVPESYEEGMQYLHGKRLMDKLR